MGNLSRRKLLVSGVAGAAGLAAASRLAEQYGLLPPDIGGIYGAGHALTYASQRLLTGQTLAREFAPEQISKAPFAKLRPFQIDAYDRMKAGGFVDWRLEVGGMVGRPASLSLADLRGLRSRTQITQLACEEGWSYIAEWTGVPLAEILHRVETPAQARYIVYYSIQPRWWESIDMTDALHPQTLLVYGMNGADLPMGHGGPLRLSVPRQLGYKSVKFITRLLVTDSLARFKKGSSYSWYAGI